MFWQGLGLSRSAVWNVCFVIHAVKPINAEVTLSGK